MRILTFLFAICLLASCASDTAKTPEKKTDNTPPTSAPSKMEKKYVVTPFADTYQYTDANMATMKYKAGTFNFDVKGDKYKLGKPVSYTHLTLPTKA